MRVSHYGEHQRSMAHGSIEGNPFITPADLAMAKVLQEFKNVTVYVHGVIQSFLGYQAFEASSVILKTMPHGNFQRAVLVLIVPRGKKKPRRYIETTQPSTVIVDGWELPALPPEHDVTGTSRYAAFDAGWDQNFAMWLNSHCQNSGFRIVADLRNHDPAPKKAVPAFISPVVPNAEPPAVGNSQSPTIPSVLDPLMEGAATDVAQSRYERNPQARSHCLAHYGLACQACGMDFATRYGELGKGFIHVHHLTPLANDGTEHEVDPVKDLRPVCPNCHAMLHRRNPPLAIAELRALLASS